MTPPPVTLDDVRAAARRIAGAVVCTPCLRSDTLSAIASCELWLKFENLQFTASFKERGARNKLLLLSEAERACGVIAASAGNHAQGVARHAALLGISAVIVMPEGTPFTKVRNTQRLGAEVLLRGDDYEGAVAAMRQLAAEQGRTIVHGFDDPHIIAGQGTAALEMLADAPDLDALVVPVGGGGLMAGMAVAAKGLNGGIEMIGVQCAAFTGMQAALDGGAPQSGGRTIAEGIAVGVPGRLNVQLCRALVDDILLVDENQLEDAVARLADIEKTVAEGAGAAALAAVLAHPDRFRGRKVGIVVSGGNIDTRLFASVLLRSLVREGRIVRVRADMADVPGSLARIALTIAQAGGNVIEVQHQRLFGAPAAKMTEIEFTVETLDAQHGQRMLAALRDAGVDAELHAAD